MFFGVCWSRMNCKWRENTNKIGDKEVVIEDQIDFLRETKRNQIQYFWVWGVHARARNRGAYLTQYQRRL